eukprot:3940428-Rhodomonas_salina.1
MVLPGAARGGGAPGTNCYPPTQLLRDVRLCACYAMSGTDLVYGAIGLRACYEMSGTDIAYSMVGLCAFYAISGTGIAYKATRSRMYLDPSYTISGTDLAYDATRLRADSGPRLCCHTASGTGIGYMLSRFGCAMSGDGVGYAAMLLLCDGQY